MINYEEKRDFHRMAVECKVDFTISGGSDVHYGEGKDLSASGVTFLSDVELAPGTQININVHPYITTIRPLSAQAEVVRCQKDGDGFVVGVKMEQVK